MKSTNPKGGHPTRICEYGFIEGMDYKVLKIERVQMEGGREVFMNELITIKKDEAVTTSLIIANQFNKRHDNVIADIRRLDCSAEFTALNFKESRYEV